MAVTVGLNGNVYIADNINRIRIVYNNGTIQTFARGTSTNAEGIEASKALIVSPVNVFLTNQSDMFIVERYRTRKVNGTSELIFTVAGNYFLGSKDSGDGGLAINAELNTPKAISGALSGSTIFISTATKIRKIDAGTGIINSFAGVNYDSTSPLYSLLQDPQTIVKLGSDIFFSDRCTVRKLSLTFNNLSIIAGTGNCGYSGDNGPATLARISTIQSVAINPYEDIYFPDTGNAIIRKVFANGTIITIAGDTTTGFYGENIPASKAVLNTPKAVAFFNNELYIVDGGNSCVRKILENGNIVTFAGICGQSGFSGDKGEATKAKLNNPSDISVDPNTGSVYIADYSNNYIRKVFPNGMIYTVATVRSPARVHVDPVGGVFVSTYNHRNVRIIGNHIVATVAGKSTSVAGYSGDNGPATNALLDNPLGMHVDGTVLFADSDNAVIRSFKVCLTGIVSNGVCIPCSAGQTADASQDNCIPCNAGFVSTGDSLCSACPAGTYSNTQKTACLPCNNTEISQPGSGSCQACPLGSFANFFKTSCVNCTVGYYMGNGGQCEEAGQTSNPNASGCIPCMGNTYAPTSGSVCMTCPFGQTANPSKTACAGGTQPPDVVGNAVKNYSSAIMFIIILYFGIFV